MIGFLWHLARWAAYFGSFHIPVGKAALHADKLATSIADQSSHNGSLHATIVAHLG